MMFLNAWEWSVNIIFQKLAYHIFIICLSNNWFYLIGFIRCVNYFNNADIKNKDFFIIKTDGINTTPFQLIADPDINSAWVCLLWQIQIVGKHCCKMAIATRGLLSQPPTCKHVFQSGFPTASWTPWKDRNLFCLLEHVESLKKPAILCKHLESPWSMWKTKSWTNTINRDILFSF